MQAMMYGPPIVGKSSLLSRLIGIPLPLISEAILDSPITLFSTDSSNISVPVVTVIPAHTGVQEAQSAFHPPTPTSKPSTLRPIPLPAPDLKSSPRMSTHSTGVSNKAVQVIVKKPQFVHAHAPKPGRKWEIMQIDVEAISLMKSMMSITEYTSPTEAKRTSTDTVPEENAGLEYDNADKLAQDEIQPQASPRRRFFSKVKVFLHFKKKRRTAAASENKPELPAEAKVQTVKEENENISTKIFKDALRNKQWKTAQALVEDAFIIYFTDTGGQPEFQEVLPALTSGPSIFFLVFRICDHLNQNYIVKYVRKTSEKSVEYKTSYTLKEVIMQSLASIASICSYSCQKDKSLILIEPKVLLIGTHKDQASAEHMQQIQKELMNTLEGTEYYTEGIVVFNTPEEPVFLVNNLSEEDSDFEVIRSKIEKVAKHKSYRVSTPASWFVFALALRTKSTAVMSMDKCLKIALECGISDENELKEALWFLHTKLGLLRYFGEIEQLSSIVICDPQLLFDKVTDLMTSTFTFEETGDVYGEKKFKNFGLVSKNLIEKILATSDENLSCAQLLLLLEHLDIVAPIRNEANEVNEYFMPSVLSHAPSAIIPQSTSCIMQDLLVLFKCGYVPKGLFGALTVQLQKVLGWKLWERGIARNLVPFLVGLECHMVTLQCHITHLEIALQAPPDAMVSSVMLEESPEIACTPIRQSIADCLTAAFKTLHYKPDQSFSFGFYCFCGGKEKHIAQCISATNPLNMQCLRTGLPICLTQHQRVWFGHPMNVSAYW